MCKRSITLAVLCSFTMSSWILPPQLRELGRWIFYQMFSHLSWKPINAQPDLRGYKKEVINASRVKTTLLNGYCNIFSEMVECFCITTFNTKICRYQMLLHIIRILPIFLHNSVNFIWFYFSNRKQLDYSRILEESDSNSSHSLLSLNGCIARNGCL